MPVQSRLIEQSALFNPEPENKYASIREFPKIADPHIMPYIVGPLLQAPRNKVPLIFGNSHTTLQDAQHGIVNIATAVPMSTWRNLISPQSMMRLRSADDYSSDWPAASIPSFVFTMQCRACENWHYGLKPVLRPGRYCPEPSDYHSHCLVVH